MTSPAPSHPAPPASSIGVLLVNLGTPDAPTPGAVRRYLGEFLSDRRVVELPPWLWQPILRAVVLPLRPRKSAAAYAQIWTKEGSPLAVITQQQAQILQDRLGPDIRVAHAMRYGQPALPLVLDEMIGSGCQRILVMPLYPQYCGATTASVVDAVNRHLANLRAQPTLHMLPPYFDDPAYIGALRQSLDAQIAALDFEPDILLASFHGMPQRTYDLGDPYYRQCLATVDLLAKAMGREIHVSFQSRFGAAKWLEPATDAMLMQLGQAGRRVAVFAPGFAADCLETLEELAIRGRGQFQSAGGRDFAYLPCLNTSDAGVMMLEAMSRRELSGWA